VASSPSSTSLCTKDAMSCTKVVVIEPTRSVECDPLVPPSVLPRIVCVSAWQVRAVLRCSAIAHHRRSSSTYMLHTVREVTEHCYGSGARSTVARTADGPCALPACSHAATLCADMRAVLHCAGWLSCAGRATRKPCAPRATIAPTMCQWTPLATAVTSWRAWRS
jgi:hypothetical protein